uniref:Uncharacterized protein n=1 Tax=Taeniopygia guttata TaxID=59729 RepID=A0A674G9E6_TAEGU
MAAGFGGSLRGFGGSLRDFGVPQSPASSPGYQESTAEFGFVERLLPPSRVPEPPPHPKYPTPSGWSPPAGNQPKEQRGFIYPKVNCPGVG